MLQGFTLKESMIRIEESAVDWKDAIRMSSQPLLEEGYIEPSYVEAMIASVIDHGPYIVIAPNIALPHARPEAGAVKIGFSVMRLKEPVYFTEDQSSYASLFIALSCVESNSHVEMIGEIAMILSDTLKHDGIFAAKTKQDILDIFNT